MKISRIVPFILAALLPVACNAASDGAGEVYRIGKHYAPARAAVPDPDTGKPNVTEVFWYGCPHCYHLEPVVKQWVTHDKPEGVEFARMPASLGRGAGILHSKAYFTAEALGVLDKLHPAMFEAMHEKHQRLATEAEIQALFAQHGIDAGTFQSTFNSFVIEGKVQQAEATIRALGITGVPAVVVDNRYVTSAAMAGGNDAVFKVVDFLVQKSSR